jgi:hypothetical protein
MATTALRAVRDAAIETFHDDVRRLDRRDWRLWGIAGFFMILMVTTIATMALEIEHHGIEIMSGMQLETAVRGLLTLVLLFSVFVVYQHVMMERMRKLMVQDLRRELATWRDISSGAGEDFGD